MAAVTICSDFGAPPKIVWHCFHCFPIYFPWSDGTRCHDLCFLKMLSFKPTFSLSTFTFIKRLLSTSSLSAIRVGVICISEVIDISSGNLDSTFWFIQPSILHDVLCIYDFLLGSVVKNLLHCRRCMRHCFHPWVGKIPQRRAWQPTPVSLQGESHGQRSPAGYSP